jgi:LysR family glycine cleavage system transcriptional activator
MTLPFRAIAVFHSVARAGSVSRAAEALSVTPSAVTQQIQGLEAYLGTCLTSKSGRRVVLTESGERYYEMIGEEFDRIAEATQFIRGYRSVSTLTIRASPSLATKWLLPHLPSFLNEYSDIEVHLDGTTEATDFAREAVDLEIRHGDGRWPGLFVEGFLQETFMPVCAPDYCAAETLAPSDVPKFRLIHSVKSQVQWQEWFLLAQALQLGRWSRIMFDRSHMSIDAACGGLGIALESNLMMWREIREGRLICPVRQPPEVVRTTQWIVCPNERLRQRKVRVFLDWLRAARQSWSENGG